MELRVLELLKAGGWIMWPLLACSAISLAIILERFWSLRRKAVLPLGLGEEVREWSRRSPLDPKHIDALRANSALGELLASALDVRHKSREIIKERLEDTGRHIAHRLERFLNPLGTIASMAPLLGLLGTVTGMIRMFIGVGAHGLGEMNALAGGIGEALVATASGISVAIPALLFHRYFRGKVSGYLIDMEREAIGLLDALEPPAESIPVPAPAPRRRSAASAGTAGSVP